jgi:hypothetical protein
MNNLSRKDIHRESVLWVMIIGYMLDSILETALGNEEDAGLMTLSSRLAGFVKSSFISANFILIWQ